MNSDDASLLTIFNETLYGNLFTYCCNNPVNRIDNSGNLSLRNKIGAGVIVAVAMRFASKAAYIVGVIAAAVIGVILAYYS